MNTQTVALFPRFTKAAAEMRFEEIKGSTIEELGVADTSVSDNAFFAQTGGHRISAEQLKTFRTSVLEIARGFGWPDQGDEKSKASFDAHCALWLLDASPICSGEAFRDSVWAYLTINLLPDVAAWRFPARNMRRFIGGVRNTFQRLWLRAFLLQEIGDRDALLDHLMKLQEDTFLQLIERPGASANPHVSSRIAAAWVMASRLENSKPMEKVHRLVMKEITQTGAVINLDSLESSQLDQMLNDLYVEFAQSES